MHMIERTDRFTLIGADARRFKLTLFVEEGPRDPGALKHVTLRVNDGDERTVELGEGLTVNVDACLDRGRLRPRPRRAVVGRSGRDRRRVPLARLQRGRSAATVCRASSSAARISSSIAGDAAEPERPLLNHVAVLVDRADDAKELAGRGRRRRGRAEHLRSVRLGPRAREDRVRRAQADVLARVVARRRRRRGHGRARRRGASPRARCRCLRCREGHPAGRVDAALELRRLAAPRVGRSSGWTARRGRAPAARRLGAARRFARVARTDDGDRAGVGGHAESAHNRPPLRPRVPDGRVGCPDRT